VFSLTFEITGADKVIKELDETASRVRDFTPVWRQIQQSFYEMMSRQYAMGGRKQWEPLSDSYARWKERVAPGRPLMVLYGHTKASLTTSSAKGSIANFSPMQLELGTAVTSERGYHYPYAHQYGLGHNKVRELIDPPPGTAGKWARMMEEYAFFIAARSGKWQSATIQDMGFEGE